jgi:rhodanese-related sulfurtransferase
MTLFPLPLNQLLGHYGAYLVFLAVGFAFGYVLEISGFGFSPKLAAQFYFKEMTVLKVMFTGIIVAMVLIFLSSALGLLDYNLIWVNPTYLWPGIVGGLLMGVGFIVGGFCPGTSLVALSTFKIDGLFFALGVLFGIFIFGETVEYFETFWYSSYMGRFTLPELFGLPTGWVVLGVVLMALFMFWGAEQLERIFGGMDPKKAPRWRYYGAGALLAVAVVAIIIGQPTTADRWERIASEKELLLNARDVQIHPGELLHTMHDHDLKLIMIDVRDEADYNLFHIADARRVDLDDLVPLSKEVQLEPPNTVVVVMSNDEAAATEAWKTLTAQSVVNVYILDGGVNNWIATFVQDDLRIRPSSLSSPPDDVLSYEFAAALGAAFPAADPDFHEWEGILEYIPKIKLELKKGPSGGGCG